MLVFIVIKVVVSHGIVNAWTHISPVHDVLCFGFIAQAYHAFFVAQWCVPKSKRKEIVFRD